MTVQSEPVDLDVIRWNGGRLRLLNSMVGYVVRVIVFPLNRFGKSDEGSVMLITYHRY